jgi:uncharacterized integral membrane protein
MSQEGSPERPAPPSAAPTAAPGTPSFPEPIFLGTGPDDVPGVVGPGGGPVRPVTAADTVEAPPPAEPLKVPRTRTSATYIGVGVGLLILILVIIFIAQNLNKASVHFIGFNFRLPLGLLVLAAAVAGGLIVLLISLARVFQLRLMARRHRRAHERP